MPDIYRVGPGGWSHGWIKEGMHVRVTSGYHGGKEGHVVSQDAGNVKIKDASGGEFLTGAHVVEPTGKPGITITPHAPAAKPLTAADVKPGMKVQLPGGHIGKITKVQSGPHGIPGVNVLDQERDYTEGYAAHWMPLSSLKLSKKTTQRGTEPTGMSDTWTRRASDLKYGHGSALWEYWTKGAGFAKWSGALHKWTALRDLLLTAGVPAASADGLTTNIIQAVMPRYMKQAHAAMEHKATGRSAVTTTTERADISDGDPGAGKSASRSELYRSYPLEDAHVVTRAEGDGSGRLVEAYCAVFDEPAEIMDHQGHYEEDINRAAFNKRIADVQRSRSGFSLIKCHYNHGMTIHGTPAERFSLPVAVPKHISAESRGVLTRSYYMDTPLGNEVLEMWREGAITAQSFTGAIIRSSPELRRGDKYRPRGGQLTRVTRMELGLKEYGPTPFPAYSGAELVGVRMSPLGTWQAADDDEHEEHEEQAEQALLPDGEAAAGSPLTRTYGDSDKHEARYHQHALYVLRSKEAREKAGLVW